MGDDLELPTLADVLCIHEDIITEDRNAEPGVRSEEAIESALTYISVGYFDQRPERIHEKAAHLLRLLVSEHPFVDGNKRTALNTISVFYDINGFEFHYRDERIREILRGLATDANAVDMEDVTAYFSERAFRAED